MFEQSYLLSDAKICLIPSKSPQPHLLVVCLFGKMTLGAMTSTTTKGADGMVATAVSPMAMTNGTCTALSANAWTLKGYQKIRRPLLLALVVYQSGKGTPIAMM